MPAPINSAGSISFLDALFRKYSNSSGSLRALGRSRNRRSRNFSGMPEKSCSIESTPISASIRWRSACEFGMYLIYGRLLFFFAGVLVVFLSGHEISCFVLVDQTNADHPSRAVRIFINFLGRCSEIVVYLD